MHHRRLRLICAVIALASMTAACGGGGDDDDGVDGDGVDGGAGGGMDSGSGGGMDSGGGGGGGGIGDPCSTGADCRTGLECVSDTCQGTGGGAAGTPCIYTVTCMMDLYCGDERECAPAGEGDTLATCETSADCLHELVCSPQPVGGLRCVSDGERDIGEFCGRVEQCIAGLFCIDGMCTGALASDMDGGMVDGGHVIDAGLGGACMTSTECDDGSMCTTDICVADVCQHNLVDGDDDGYPSTIILGGCGSDCCDTNPTVNPEHTAFETTRHAGNPPLEPATYDWNCDRIQQPEYPSSAPACLSSEGTCITGEGWLGAVPACGTVGTWVRCTGPSAGCVVQTIESRTQACR